MLRDLYRRHGELCAHHPWEVIVIIITLTSCLICMDNSFLPSLSKEPLYHCQGQSCQLYNVIDAIIMTAIRCIAVLYSYYQLRHLYQLGSKYLLGFAGLFTVFSSFIFCSSVIKFLGGEMSDLKDALFFFLLLIDLSKASLLVQIAVSTSNPNDIESQIAKGLELIGPSLTLDAIVETLVISIGTLSGIRRLEILSYYACLSVIINFVLFMTFYPACLSLILDLSRIRNDGSRDPKTPSWQEKLIFRFHCFKTVFKNEFSIDKHNPVVDRVKVVMSFGLVIVHLSTRWSTIEVQNDTKTPLPLMAFENELKVSEETSFWESTLKLISFSAEHIVLLIIVLSLTIKFIFFEKPAIDPVDDKMNLLENKKSSNEQKEVFCKDCLSSISEEETVSEIRDVAECVRIFKENNSAELLNDEEIQELIKQKHIAAYQLEKIVRDPVRAVGIRRKLVARAGGFYSAFSSIPFKNYDYQKVTGVCCENVIGFLPVPLGVAGPLIVDGEEFYVPLATTEGCLVASVNRGCRALRNCGVIARVEDTGMTRGPALRFPSASRASEAKIWLMGDGFASLKKSFDSTSRFARLLRVESKVVGRHLYVRFVSLTGDAMGMNMVSKGTEAALSYMSHFFPDMNVVSLSGNFCADKKPAAVNWICGRGKSVVCDAVVPGTVVQSILKTSVAELVNVNHAKNLVGSAVAGSVGGFNAHAANIVTAIYIATGQDPAQNVCSSNCITLMEPWGQSNEDLYISCTMPSIEVGTIGGGTRLDAQHGCLSILGVSGPHSSNPGRNAETLAKLVCSTVLAGELSLLAALTAGHLVDSHLQHNRSCQQQ